MSRCLETLQSSFIEFLRIVKRTLKCSLEDDLSAIHTQEWMLPRCWELHFVEFSTEYTHIYLYAGDGDVTCDNWAIVVPVTFRYEHGNFHQTSEKWRGLSGERQKWLPTVWSTWRNIIFPVLLLHLWFLSLFLHALDEQCLLIPTLWKGGVI